MGLSSGASVSGSPAVPGVVLIRDADFSRGSFLASHFTPLGIAVHRNIVEVESADVDIAIVQLVQSAHRDGLVEAAEVLRRDPATEVILFAERDCPDLAVAEGLGLSRVLAANDLIAWVTAAAPHLIRRARLRRVFREVERSIPDPPPVSWSRQAGSVPLPIAEQRFRETYLRMLLAVGGSRDVVQMIRKLGIDIPEKARGRHPETRKLR